MSKKVYASSPHAEAIPLLESQQPAINAYAKPAFLVCVLFLAAVAHAKVSIAPVPDEIRTDRFTVTIDGHPTSFAHAAANYYFLNFDLKGKAKIAITAPSDDYWARGVEVQPWSLSIRPALKGRTITFTLTHPAKLSISRPGDHLAGAEMLFVFANPPETDAPKATDPKDPLLRARSSP